MQLHLTRKEETSLEVQTYLLRQLPCRESTEVSLVLVALNESLQTVQNLHVRHRKRVHVEAQHAGDHSSQLHQLHISHTLYFHIQGSAMNTDSRRRQELLSRK